MLVDQAKGSRIDMPFLTPHKDKKLGSNCSGSSGETNRILTLNNTELTKEVQVIVSGTGLHEGTGKDFTVVHNPVGTQITFLNPLWDDQPIDVLYFTTKE